MDLALGDSYPSTRPTSSLTTDVSKMFDETNIWIELPNDTMKKEVEREQYDLMTYLKQRLNNHFISLRITVNEETAKKFAFPRREVSKIAGEKSRYRSTEEDL